MVEGLWFGKNQCAFLLQDSDPATSFLQKGNVASVTQPWEAFQSSYCFSFGHRWEVYLFSLCFRPTDATEKRALKKLLSLLPSQRYLPADLLGSQPKKGSSWMLTHHDLPSLFLLGVLRTLGSHHPVAPWAPDRWAASDGGCLDSFTCSFVTWQAMSSHGTLRTLSKDINAWHSFINFFGTSYGLVPVALECRPSKILTHASARRHWLTLLQQIPSMTCLAFNSILYVVTCCDHNPEHCFLFTCSFFRHDLGLRIFFVKAVSVSIRLRPWCNLLSWWKQVVGDSRVSLRKISNALHGAT